MVSTPENINTASLHNGVLNCACVIHGDTYAWTYVERLHNMLQKNISAKIKLHVYTEADRTVPEHMIKHTLTDWGISGPRRGWWYKMQLFNSEHFGGPLLYFDLDTVITQNIDWICNLPTKYFWTVKDFKYLWRPTHQGINSSIMWWDTRQFDHVWKNFKSKDLNYLIKQHAGDQDFLTREISAKVLRFMDPNRIKSWRWQCLDGGYDFKQRIYKNPKTGTDIGKDTSVLIFHGNPKPENCLDPVIVSYWQ